MHATPSAIPTKRSGYHLPPTYHELVLQGFQNLVGLTPQPNQDNQINHHVLSQYLKVKIDLAGLEPA